MNNLEVDVRPALNMFAELSPRNQRKAYKSALRKSCNVVAKETKRKLRSQMGAAATHVGRFGKKLVQGVKVRVARDGLSAKVHILGDFRLKFFEMGTEERHLRRGNHPSRGRITAKYFFRQARQSKEQEAADSLERNLEQSIIRINNRYR